MLLTRSVTTSLPIETVFAYFADFTNTTHWDPGTVLTTRISGDGGVGSVYANTSRFNGRTTELLYTVAEFEANRRVVLHGENKTVHATDTLAFETLPEGGTRFTYSAEFRFAGIARLAAPFLGKAFRTLADEAEHGIREALQQLSNQGESHV